MATCFDVAKYFLSQTDEDAGDTLSNLKLQKLVYYAQGFHLALNDNPLFDEQIVAWTHGPVVEVMYHTFKRHGASNIPFPDEINPDSLTSEQEELLQEVQDIYGQFSAWKLRDMTHQEPPWRDTEKESVISHESMKSYFQTQLINE